MNNSVCLVREKRATLFRNPSMYRAASGSGEPEVAPRPPAGGCRSESTLGGWPHCRWKGLC